MLKVNIQSVILHTTVYM